MTVAVAVAAAVHMAVAAAEVLQLGGCGKQIRRPELVEVAKRVAPCHQVPCVHQ